VAGGPPRAGDGHGRPTAPLGQAMFGRATYLVLMAACLLVTLPLELVLKAGVYRRPRRWLAALVPVFLVFNLWDWVAIRRGHWTYSPRYTTGIELLGLPLEELVFFVVVPTCALLTYQAVTRLLPGPDHRRAPR
jgi:lycopene cyclase domain-containing protein